MVRLPRTEPETTIVVTVFEGLPDVLGRLRAAANQPVRLEIPAGSPLFLTAAEFRALREVAQDRRIGLTVVTDDPLRRQLAGVFALPVEGQDGPRGAPAAAPTRPAVADRVPRHERTGLPDLPSGQPVERRPRPESGSTAVPAESTRDTRRREDLGSLPPLPGGGAREGDAEVQPPRRAGSTITWPASSGGPSNGAATGSGDRTPIVAGGGRRRRGAVSAGAAAGSGAVVAGPAADWADDDAHGHDRDRAGGGWRDLALTRRTAALGAVAAVIALALFVGATLLFFSRATVTVRRAEQAVEAELRYQLGGGNAAAAAGEMAGGESLGQPLGTGGPRAAARGEQPTPELTIPVAPLDLELTWEGSIATTGTRAEPDKPARGRVRLANPGTESVTVKAGTEITSDAKVKYRFVDDVTVRGGDPGLGEYGGAEAEVEAVTPGTAGNLGVGELWGQLKNKVYYSNRDAAIEGGTDKVVKTVAPADVAALRRQAETELARQSEGDLASRLEPGTAVVPGSVKLGELEVTFSRQAGDDAETLRLTAKAAATGSTYETAEVNAQATASLQGKLAASTPAGFAMDPGSLVLGEPEPVAGEFGVFRVTARGRALAELPEQARADLAEDLAGKSVDEVAAIVRANPAVAGFDVDYSPGWLPDRMPISDDRIEIEVAP